MTPRRDARSGQAVLELAIGLVALLAGVVAILAAGLLARADTSVRIEAQEAAHRAAVGGGTVSLFEPLSDVDPGPDGRPLTSDDKPVAGSMARIQEIAARAVPPGAGGRDAFRRPGGGRIGSMTLIDLADGASGTAALSLHEGRAERAVELPPAAGALFGLPEEASVRAETWMPSTGGLE